jgi:hypothetical protein
MGTIAMSPSMVTGVTSRFMMNNTNNPYTAYPIADRGLLSGHATSAGEVGARLFLMKGTVPYDFSTLTTFGARSADVLVTFDATSYTGGGTNNFVASQDNVNPIVVTSIYRTATQSGTATWFWWFTSALTGTNTWSNAAVPLVQIIGTVGTIGSNSDLEFSTTNIVSGQDYRVFNLRLQIPTSWVY